MIQLSRLKIFRVLTLESCVDSEPVDEDGAVLINVDELLAESEVADAAADTCINRSSGLTDNSSRL